ncbi:aspartyl ase SAP3 precursor [Fusarium beomiforme]|uniref:Aspartyl ase SAP3 n=1 Tax=Fusarium beomiforme TaxID=44412 RepID=A0A9P5B1E4_9HYPO|nr:aspartyl ase SAP3 precursor [Fusarium beomiforme]
MRTFTLLTSLAVGVSAGTVSAPIVKQRFHHDSSLDKRDTLGLAALNNVTGGGYYAEFQIGTPGQNISFQLDTGSSDTWLNSDDTDLCKSKAKQENIGPCMTTFKPDKSSTFKLVDRDGFDIAYLDSREISGDYFNDTVTIDGKSIKQQRLGLASESVRPTGIMGLGFSSNVVANGTYPTIVENMVSQGLIKRAAFSLWLNDLDSEQGTILFGGLDTKKFVGKLATLPLLPDPTTLNLTHFTVSLQDFAVKTPKGQDELKIDSLRKDTVAILDSGATVCLLPEDQVGEIYKAFNVLSVEQVAVPFVDCAYGKDKGKGVSFEFKFDGKTISVPMSEMVINAFPDKQEIFDDPAVSSYFDDWDSVCMFGISPISHYGLPDSYTLLGDTFLRSAYVVYDLANEQLGIAEANHDTNESDIVELQEKDTKFPDVTGVQGTSSSEDDDNAADHLSPASMVTLVMAAGIVLTFL